MRRAILVACVWLVITVPALGQGQANRALILGLGQGLVWELEVHGGGLFNPEVPDGTRTLPPPGSGFITGDPLQSRRVSSWYLADGAQLLNEVALVIGASARITPLDTVLNRPLADRRGGAGGGFRLSRELGGRFAAEFNFDYASTRFELRESARSGLTATSGSFRPAFAGILVPAGAFQGLSITSTDGIDEGRGSEATATGALRVRLLTRGRFIPYVTAGAGLTRLRGEGPVATLNGAYSFQFAGLFPFAERDQVSVRQVFDERLFVGVVGGGVTAELTPRSGVRVDVRAHIGSTSDRILLDATPSITTTIALPFEIFSLTNPSISFSSFPQPSVAPPSSLSGPALDDFTTFEVTRTRNQVLVTVGYFFRF